LNKRKLKFGRILFCQILAIIIAVIIIILSFGPFQQFSSILIFGNDKVYHFIAYFCLTFTISLALSNSILWVLAGIIVLGGAIELMQPIFNREASWTDFLAGGIGTFFGVISIRYLFFWFFGYDVTINYEVPINKDK
jgi:VanZ family protein|tara:strand:- start:182 stop:592 length:411 start_codon:yes stop_codon:yes gene_type:complete